MRKILCCCSGITSNESRFDAHIWCKSLLLACEYESLMPESFECRTKKLFAFRLCHKAVVNLFPLKSMRFRICTTRLLIVLEKKAKVEHEKRTKSVSYFPINQLFCAISFAFITKRLNRGRSCNTAREDWKIIFWYFTREWFHFLLGSSDGRDVMERQSM